MAKLTVDDLRRRIDEGDDLDGLDLSGLDLRALGESALKGGSLERCNLRGATLAGMDLSDCVFDEADLTQADLSEATLKDATFMNAMAEEATFSGATLCGADFDDATLTRADFCNADLTDVTFNNATLNEAVFAGAKLREADCGDTHCTGASFAGADLTEANFGNSQLRQAIFRDATLREASLHDADLTEAVLIHADLSQADLEEAILRKADFTDAILTDADLEEADLTGANFTRAVLRGANLEDAVIENTDFTGADLSGTRLEPLDEGDIDDDSEDLDLSELAPSDDLPADRKQTRERSAVEASDVDIPLLGGKVLSDSEPPAGAEGGYGGTDGDEDGELEELAASVDADAPVAVTKLRDGDLTIGRYGKGRGTSVPAAKPKPAPAAPEETRRDAAAAESEMGIAVLGSDMDMALRIAEAQQASAPQSGLRAPANRSRGEERLAGEVAPPPAPDPPIARHTSVRYFTQMNPMRNYPMLVSFTPAPRRAITGKTTAQVSNPTPFGVSARNPVVEVIPHFPGCLCVPDRIEVDVRPELAQAHFWVTPQTEGDLSDARVEVHHEGHRLDSIPTPTRSVRQTWAKVGAVIGVLLPVGLAILDGLGFSTAARTDTAFAALSDVATWAGGWTNLGMLTGGIVLLLASILLFLSRPQQASPAKSFFEMQPLPPLGRAPHPASVATSGTTIRPRSTRASRSARQGRGGVDLGVVFHRARLLVQAGGLAADTNPARLIPLVKPITRIGPTPGCDIVMPGLAETFAVHSLGGGTFQLHRVETGQTESLVPDSTVAVPGGRLFFFFDQRDPDIDTPGGRDILDRLLATRFPDRYNVLAATFLDEKPPIRRAGAQTVTRGYLTFDEWEELLDDMKHMERLDTVLA